MIRKNQSRHINATPMFKFTAITIAYLGSAVVMTAAVLSVASGDLTAAGKAIIELVFVACVFHAGMDHSPG